MSAREPGPGPGPERTPIDAYVDDAAKLYRRELELRLASFIDVAVLAYRAHTHALLTQVAKVHSQAFENENAVPRVFCACGHLRDRHAYATHLTSDECCYVLRCECHGFTPVPSPSPSSSSGSPDSKNPAGGSRTISRKSKVRRQKP